MDIYDSIEAKYGFAIPPEYRRMEGEGFFDLKHPGYYDAEQEPTYLWISEAEWLKPAEILSHEPEPYHEPGLVPFAFTGAGDNWCWWPAHDREAVVLCPHDETMAVFNAPNFLGSIYRRCLDYSLDGIDTREEARARRHLTRWAERLAGYFPPQWIEVLRSLALADVVEWHEGKRSGRGFLSLRRYNALVSRDLGFPRLDQEIRWMRP